MARPAVAAEQLSRLNAQRTDLTGQSYLPVHRWREHSPGAITLGEGPWRRLDTPTRLMSDPEIDQGHR